MRTVGGILWAGFVAAASLIAAGGHAFAAPKPPAIEVSPTTILPGIETKITVTGTGFRPRTGRDPRDNSIIQISRRATLVARSADGSAVSEPVMLQVTEDFVATISLPASLEAGIYTVRADSDLGSPEALVEILAPEIALEPESAPAGTSLVVSGVAFLPNAEVDRIRIGPVSVLNERVETNAAGAFRTTVIVPSVPPGRVDVDATMGHFDSSALLTVEDPTTPGANPAPSTTDATETQRPSDASTAGGSGGLDTTKIVVAAVGAVAAIAAAFFGYLGILAQRKKP